MNADSIKIECEEDGMWMVVDVDGQFFTGFQGQLRIRIQDIAEELHDTVKREIGPWLYERDQARTAVAAGVSLKAYLKAEGDDIDESAGYALDDPKHPDFHSVHSDIWDAREGK